MKRHRQQKNTSKHYVVRGIMLCLVVFLCFPLFSQSQISIKGKVTDTSSEPLIGVSIVIEGTTIGTITDLDGNYSLSVPSDESYLVYSYVGFETIKEKVDNRRVINVSLIESAQNLSELVVVGYGIQKKETVTGSVSTVKGSELLKSPVTNLSNTLVGRMSGVNAFQRSGEPGYDGSTIRIRGSNTLGNNDPLIIIDGVAARAGGLDRVDPAEIENISVLKDASAAIYGSRAANGVILVTTRTGKTNQAPQVSYSFNQGWSSPTRKPEMTNSAEYATLRNEIIINDASVNPMSGEDPKPYTLWKTEEEIQKYRDGSDPWFYPDTDWYKAVLADWSPQRTHNVTLDGGSEKFQYFVTFGHRFQDGIYKKSANNYEQTNLRINLDFKINDWMDVDVGMLGRQENRNFPSQGAGSLFGMTARGRPTDHAYWPNGKPAPAQERGHNPVVAATNETGYTKDRRYFIQTNASLNIKIPGIEGLNLRGSVSYDKRLDKSTTWFQPWYLYDWDGRSYEEDGVTPKLEASLNYPSHSDPSLDKRSADQTNMVLSAILSYNRNFGDHGIDFLVGTERDESDRDYFDAYRRYYLSTALHTFKAGGDKEKNNSSGGDDANWNRARLNYFGRLAYNYKEKYLAEFVWRVDGSYMFASGERYGFFPGVLLGYRISEEEFWKNNLSFIDYFKIKASWGQLGNDQIYFDGTLQEYQFDAAYRYSWGYIIDNEDKKGLSIARFPNPHVTWEVANNLNVGIEGRLLEGLYFEIDYFYNKRSNILWRRNASIPKTAGLTLPAENIGKVDNKGFDFKLEWNDRIGKDFLYQISATGGYSSNKIKFWDEAPGAPEYQRSTGKRMNTGLYFKADGVFKDWDEINDENRPNYDGITSDKDLKPGDIKFKDVNGDGKITPDDRVRMNKNDEPKFTYGINASLQYKNFDFTMLWQGAAGSWTKVYFDSGEFGNYFKRIYDNRWSPDQPSSKYPRVHAREQYYWDSGAGANNTFWMVSTSYLRLKNIELGYTIPAEIVSKTKILSGFRVYVSGHNLLTISPSREIDPESTSRNGSGYLQTKVLNFGFTANF